MADLLGLRTTGVIDNKAAASSSGGWPNAGKAMINSTEYATIAAAITAAAAGDIIKVGQGTFTETLTVDEVVTLVALDPIDTIITSAASATITVTSAGAAFRNLGIRNTAGGGTDSTIVQSNVNNCVYENCVFIKTGAADDSACILQYGGTGTQIINCELTTTGATKNYAIWNNTSTTTIEVRGGKLSGTTQDILGDQAGSTLLLVKPVFVNNLISFSGTISGDYLDNSGNIRQALTNDIFPNNDVFGLWNRLINFGRIPDEHWRQGADELAWTGWAAYTGFATPSVLTRTISKLTATHSGASRAFYYRSFINAQTVILSSCMTSLASETGLMVDDGASNADGLGANNFVRFFIEWPTATANANLSLEVRSGGGAVTKTTFLSFPPSNLFGIALTYGIGTRWTSWNILGQVIGTGGLIINTASAAGLTWTPVRHGIFARFPATTGRAAVWDWFEEA